MVDAKISINTISDAHKSYKRLFFLCSKRRLSKNKISHPTTLIQKVMNTLKSTRNVSRFSIQVTP